MHSRDRGRDVDRERERDRDRERDRGRDKHKASESDRSRRHESDRTADRKRQEEPRRTRERSLPGYAPWLLSQPKQAGVRENGGLAEAGWIEIQKCDYASSNSHEMDIFRPTSLRGRILAMTRRLH